MIGKVQIELNYMMLATVISELSAARYRVHLQPEQKAVMAIVSEVVRKLERKEIDKRDTTNKFKMNFKYYEAFALERACRQMAQNYASSTYEGFTALNIANQIDKQL